MSFLGLEETKNAGSSSLPPIELDDDEKEYERVQQANRNVVIWSLVLGFFVGFFVAEIERLSILDPFMQRLSAALGFVVAILLFAGIPSAIAAKFTPNWRWVWAGITALLLISNVTMYFYEARYEFR